MRLFLFVFLWLPWHLALAQDSWQNVERVVAIGDLHGDYEQYLKVLKLNELIDRRLKWRGGKTHLVQLGDIPDRGPDSLKIILHLQKLEKQARKKGGYVHALIGNHEVMNVSGDYRYVHPGEYSALVDRKSRARQLDWLKRVFAHRLKIDPALGDKEDEVMANLAQEYPLGYIEHRGLWHPGRDLASWVANHNAVIKINRTLFLHGGLNPHAPLLPLNEMNRKIQEEISNGQLYEQSLASNPEGPLWYRGLARHPASVELQPLIAMLDFYEADRIVIAHTPTRGQVMQRFEGRVLMADVGLSAAYGGHLANLVLEGDQVYNVTPKGKSKPVVLEVPELELESEPGAEAAVEDKVE